MISPREVGKVDIGQQYTSGVTDEALVDFLCTFVSIVTAE